MTGNPEGINYQSLGEHLTFLFYLLDLWYQVTVPRGWGSSTFLCVGVGGNMTVWSYLALLIKSLTND